MMLRLCQSVDVYGFGVKGLANQTTPFGYHYYKGFAARHTGDDVHCFDAEEELLMRMGEEGYLDFCTFNDSKEGDNWSCGCQHGNIEECRPPPSRYGLHVGSVGSIAVVSVEWAVTRLCDCTDAKATASQGRIVRRLMLSEQQRSQVNVIAQGGVAQDPGAGLKCTSLLGIVTASSAESSLSLAIPRESIDAGLNNESPQDLASPSM
eukprot:scaffold2580_cov388-Prasinococcus_capsulatus_cf.AAC.4